MLQISTKQNKIATAIKQGKQQIVLAGSLGTSKTFGCAVMLISLAKQYENCVIGVGRKNMTEMKRGTMLSFNEAARKMGVTDYHENRQESYWLFGNGSRIIFFEIDQSRDREFSKIKSMNLTCAFIDEADAVAQEGYLAVYGRVGRANDEGQPSFLLLACNPNESWIKELFYDKHKNNTLPDDTEFIEFEVYDSFLGEDYYAKFANAPSNWRKRYLYNDWSYADDENSLFKYATLDRSHITTLEDGTRYAALDVARYGQDRSIAALWQGPQLIDIMVLKDKDDKVDNIELAKLYQQYLKNNSVGYEHACVDAVGNGSGVVDYLKSIDIHVREFIAGGQAKGNYNNIRSEATHQLAQAFEREETKLLDSCPYLTELKKELTMQNYEIKDRQVIVESKDKIKQRLGASPDIADAVIMAYSLQMQTDLISVDDIALW
jgi:hypothetical protein